MEYSVTLAQILGPFYFIIAVTFLFKQDRVEKMIKAFEKSELSMVIGGLLALFVGMLLVVTHNVWVADWPVLITILGWLALVKGILLIALPKEMMKLTESFRKSTMGLKIGMIGWLIFSLYLSFVGYFG